MPLQAANSRIYCHFAPFSTPYEIRTVRFVPHIKKAKTFIKGYDKRYDVYNKNRLSVANIA
jgi:hypothetical protein